MPELNGTLHPIMRATKIRMNHSTGPSNAFVRVILVRLEWHPDGGVCLHTPSFFDTAFPRAIFRIPVLVGERSFKNIMDHQGRRDTTVSTAMARQHYDLYIACPGLIVPVCAATSPGAGLSVWEPLKPRLSNSTSFFFQVQPHEFRAHSRS